MLMPSLSDIRAPTKKKLQIDSRHADTLCSYALLLEQEREDVSGAEKMYRRALEACPDHVAALFQYAMMLDDKVWVSQQQPPENRTMLDIGYLSLCFRS